MHENTMHEQYYDNNNRFKIRRCMNVHYDIILKTTENNNAMRW